MISIKIPTTREFWLWLFRYSYKRVAKPVTSMPMGIPGNRDPDNPCYAFSPRPRHADDWGECETDGHYMCDELKRTNEVLYAGPSELLARDVATVATKILPPMKKCTISPEKQAEYLSMNFY